MLLIKLLIPLLTNPSAFFFPLTLNQLYVGGKMLMQQVANFNRGEASNSIDM